MQHPDEVIARELSQEDNATHEAAVKNELEAEHEHAEVLLELYELLNQYAPPWYSHEHYRKVKHVLTKLGQL